jgi:hypothetical protein
MTTSASNTRQIVAVYPRRFSSLSAADALGGAGVPVAVGDAPTAHAARITVTIRGAAKRAGSLMGVRSISASPIGSNKRESPGTSSRGSRSGCG